MCRLVESSVAGGERKYLDSVKLATELCGQIGIRFQRLRGQVYAIEAPGGESGNGTFQGSKEDRFEDQDMVGDYGFLNFEAEKVVEMLRNCSESWGLAARLTKADIYFRNEME